MTLLALYWSTMIACYLIAGKLRSHKDRFHFLDKLTSFFIYLLIFLMGLRMGARQYRRAGAVHHIPHGRRQYARRHRRA